MPRPDSPVDPEQLLHLAQAFEGMAGAMHGLRPVAQEDLEAACVVAHEVWPARAAGDVHDREYENARAEVRKFAAAAAKGDAKACTWIERAAHHMALALRWRARADLPPRAPRNAMPAHARERIIKVLDRRYARYAQAATAAI